MEFREHLKFALPFPRGASVLMTVVCVRFQYAGCFGDTGL